MTHIFPLPTPHTYRLTNITGRNLKSALASRNGSALGKHNRIYRCSLDPPQPNEKLHCSSNLARLSLLIARILGIFINLASAILQLVGVKAQNWVNDACDVDSRN